MLQKIIDAMLAKERLEKLGKTTYLVLWKSLEEWSRIIYDWVNETGRNNMVCTLYEIQNGEDVADLGFYLTNTQNSIPWTLKC